MKEKNRGITLITLIITVIILLILVGTSIGIAINSIDKEKIRKSQAEIEEKMGQQEVETNSALEERERFDVPSEDYEVEVPDRWITADGEVTFSTDYGTIEVIWLSGTTNNVSQTPNAPVLTEGSNSMTPVKWTSNTDTNPTVTTASDADWYNYVAGTGTADNLNSHWANAKTANGAYFVWIPRYAYRITYYSDSAKTDITGYYDGRGMWRASDNQLRQKLEPGVETVTYNEKKYIVHPAFTDCVDMGGWDSDIAGFWVAKYEMSGTITDVNVSSSELTSIPNVASLRSKSIANQYVAARNATYGYPNCLSETITSDGTDYTHTSYMHSHMLKNSEWGAVAYLTHSQYGRNGNEIDVNNSKDCITGNGGGSTSASYTPAYGTTNAYNTETGVKASSTGNIYGIYDLAGGAYEYTAGYNKLGDTSWGKKITQENYISTKYTTVYSNETSTYGGNNVVYSLGKTGEATKEVNKGGAYSSSDTTYRYNWQNAYNYIPIIASPFLVRGGWYGPDGHPCIFSSFMEVRLAE